MTTGEWRRVRDLFEEALDREGADLESWIAREAADEPAVAAEVRALLEQHARAGRFLEEPLPGRVSHLFDEDRRFSEGDVVGPYTIGREIGRGGMGRVYRAIDARLGRAVAVKVLPPAMAQNPRERERLRREARAAASLTHPGICTVYALEELDEEVLIVSELVDGETLRTLIDRGPRPSPGELMDTARQIAAALASAHAAGVTHRDLKPENVMRTRDGRMKILDFGLAVLDPLVANMDEERRLTIPGGLMGTRGPTYLPSACFCPSTRPARTLLPQTRRSRTLRPCSTASRVPWTTYGPNSRHRSWSRCSGA
jgi:serine/threonine protein kinase